MYLSYRIYIVSILWVFGRFICESEYNILYDGVVYLYRYKYKDYMIVYLEDGTI